MTSPLQSWAADAAAVALRQELANELAGVEISAIRYFSLDYGRDHFAPTHNGPRVVSSLDEWRHPSWSFGVYDCVDFGLEVETSNGRLFSIGWESPGWHEGIAIAEAPMLGGVLPTADFAMWDVTTHSRWSSIIGCVVTHVHLHYIPWDPADGSFWCDHLTLEVGGKGVEVFLGDCRPDGEPTPSADTVTIAFSASDLPGWLSARRSA